MSGLVSWRRVPQCRPESACGLRPALRLSAALHPKIRSGRRGPAPPPRADAREPPRAAAAEGRDFADSAGLIVQACAIRLQNSPQLSFLFF